MGSASVHRSLRSRPDGKKRGRTPVPNDSAAGMAVVVRLLLQAGGWGVITPAGQSALLCQVHSMKLCGTRVQDVGRQSFADEPIGRLRTLPRIADESASSCRRSVA